MKTIQSLADILTSLTSDVRKDKPTAINIRKYTTINRELENLISKSWKKVLFAFYFDTELRLANKLRP